MLKVIAGYRPSFRYPVPDSYKNLIEECWDNDPNKRPSFNEIVHRLKNDIGFITENVCVDDFLDYVDLIDNNAADCIYMNDTKLTVDKKLSINNEENYDKKILENDDDALNENHQSSNDEFEESNHQNQNPDENSIINNNSNDMLEKKSKSR